MLKFDKKKKELIETFEECVEKFEFKETPEEIDQEMLKISKILAKKLKHTAPEHCIRLGIALGMKIFEKGANLNEEKN